MRLVLVRHAIAVDREEFSQTGQDDSLRPLTSTGRAKMRSNARGLQRVVPAIDVLASSPLVRARQTADVLIEIYGRRAVAIVDALEPEQRPAGFARWLKTNHAEYTVMAVGHEPQLGVLASWFLSEARVRVAVGREDASFINLKKGGAIMLNFSDEPRAGAATLEWALTPSQLRRLAR